MFWGQLSVVSKEKRKKEKKKKASNTEKKRSALKGQCADLGEKKNAS